MKGRLIRHKPKHRCPMPGWWLRFVHGILLYDWWVCDFCGKTWVLDFSPHPSMSFRNEWREPKEYELKEEAT